MTDSVVELEEGKIVRQGSPNELFLQQAVPQSAGFKSIGQIIAITPQKENVLLTFSISDQVLKIPVTPQESQQFRIGDRLELHAKMLPPFLKKGPLDE